MRGFLLLCLKLDIQKHGGVQMRIRNYATTLNKFGFQPVIISIQDTPRATQSSYLGAPLFIVPKRAVWIIAKTLVSTILRYRIIRLHVIEGTTGIAQIIALLIGTCMRLQTSAAVYSGEFVDLSRLPWYHKSRTLFFLTLFLTQRIAANSRATASLLTQWANKTRIVYPGVSLELLTQARHPSPFTKKYRLLFVGRHFRRKGIDDILISLSLLQKRFGTSIECIFVGKDVMTTPDKLTKDMAAAGVLPHIFRAGQVYSITAWYKTLAHHLGLSGICTFAGDVKTIARYYCHADVVILPSKVVEPVEGYEGFGNVLVEAALFHKPTIGTRHFGIPEAIIHNKTGLLVPEADPKSLAQAIASLLLHPAKAHALGDAGYLRVMAKFTQHQSTQQLIDLFA